jgi:site-specific DNA-cytosine methylase
MRLLELFSGTGSVGEVFRAAGWETVSVDNAPTAPCDVIADILTLDPRDFDREHGPFDCIWASPPCTQYSVARTFAKTPRSLGLADALVAKAIQFIDVIKPKAWFLENPWTGLLKSRPVVAPLGPPVVLDYCRYGRPFRKRTAIWTNRPLQGLLCRKGSFCGGWDGRGHPSAAQQGGKCPGGARNRLCDLHRVPRALVEAVVAACT